MDLRTSATSLANWKATLSDLPESTNRMYIYDCKRQGVLPGAEAMKHPFRRSPAIDKKSFGVLVHALLLGKGQSVSVMLSECVT